MADAPRAWQAFRQMRTGLGTCQAFFFVSFTNGPFVCLLPPRGESGCLPDRRAFGQVALYLVRRSALDWMAKYQPFVTTGAGVFPIGYLPIGALPIGIFPIGALPITGCGGGGWGCGKSAATTALSIPSDVAVAMRNFIPPPSITTDSNRLRDPKHVAKLLPEHRVNKSAAAKKRTAWIVNSRGCCSGVTPRQVWLQCSRYVAARAAPVFATRSQCGPLRHLVRAVRPTRNCKRRS